MELYVDNSKRSSFATCPRKYYLRYIKHLTPTVGSAALRFGSAWHGIMEGYYGSIISNGWSGAANDHADAGIQLGKKVWDEETESQEFMDDYRTLDNAYLSFVDYLEEFQGDINLKQIIATERIFDIGMELTNYEKEFLFPQLNGVELHFTGKLDLEVELGGQHWIEEFKTTGQPISVQADRLQRSAQILGYTWAAKHLGADIAGTLVSIHQITSRKVQSGGYGKVTRKFLRQPNIFSEADLRTWRESYLSTCNRIADATTRDFFPCEYDSCYQFGRCGFTRLCEQNRPYEELNMEGYIKKPWNVLETGASKDDVKVIKA